jgi:hypothetical protein
MQVTQETVTQEILVTPWEMRVGDRLYLFGWWWTIDHITLPVKQRFGYTDAILVLRGPDGKKQTQAIYAITRVRCVRGEPTPRKEVRSSTVTPERIADWIEGWKPILAAFPAKKMERSRRARRQR